MIKTCIVIAGPTAIGKTSVAIAVAHHYSTEIISADSRQCYKELDIGVAKPTAGELAAVPHHFVDHLSVTEEFTVADYERFAVSKANELFLKHDIIVVTGGTGLYLKAFTDGLDDIPAIDEAVRSNIRQRVENEGIDWAKEILKTADPGFYQTESIHNPQRVMRALEVFQSTGNSLSSYHRKSGAKRSFNTVKICLQTDTENLYARINKRVDDMMEAGLEEEVRSLIPYRQFNALNTVGYKELFTHLDGENSLAEAIDAIKRNTRRYAKRQNTWFRNSGGYVFAPANAEAVLQLIESTAT